MIFNMVGGGGGSGATLVVSSPANVSVNVSKDNKTYTKNSGSLGSATFKGLATGTWTVVISGNGQTATRTIEITADYAITIAFFSATINITYPANSNCVVANSGGQTIASDTNTGTSAKTWTATVNATGTYTVTATATDGSGKTKSTTVSITAEGQVKTVTLVYEFIMVPNDDYSTFWTGKTTNTVYGQFNITRDSIYLKYNDRGRTYVQTSEKISCQAGSVITINVSAYVNEAKDNNGKSYLYIASAAPSGVSNLTAYTEITSTGKKTLAIVSAGSYYIGLLNGITGGGGSLPTKDLSTTVDSFILS